MEEKDIQQLLESCRPGSNDLECDEMGPLRARLESDAELAQTMKHVEQWDTRITEAVHDVTAPEGLADRLLAKLAESSGETEPGSDPISAAVESVVPEGDATVAPPAVDHRRKWLWATCATVAAAVVAMVVIAPWQSGTVPTTTQELVSAAMQFDRQGDRSGAAPIDNEPRLRKYPISAEIDSHQDPRWRLVDNFLGRKAIAYDLAGPHGVTATLYVSKHKIKDLPGSPRAQIPQDTGGLWSAAWRENDLTYVLVARSTPQVTDPQRFFLRPSTPIL